MYKSVPNARGYLLAPLAALANVMTVSDEAYYALLAILGLNGTDHTYMRIGVAPQCEHVRVVAVGESNVSIARGLDNTDAIAFPELTEVAFVFCEPAVMDLTAAMPTINVTMTGTGAATVEQIATNSFNVHVAVPAVTSPDSSIEIAGEYPNIQITTSKKAAGCCD